MRMGLMAGAAQEPDSSINGLIALAQKIEGLGFSNMWMAHISEHDAIMALTIAARETENLSVGTAVTAVYPRHPLALAQQALSAGAATGGRFKLGIGLAHKIVVENMWGFSYDKPASYMREYMQVLLQLMAGEVVDFSGEYFNVHGVQISQADHQNVPILIAALGPVMLKLAGEMSDGTITWMTGTKTLEDHIIPSIRRSAEDAGKPAPAIVSAFPITLASNTDAARERINTKLNVYGQLPSYRAMLDREGAAYPADVSLIGDEKTLRDGLQHLRDIGVTDFGAAIIGEDDQDYYRTLEFLGSEIS